MSIQKVKYPRTYHLPYSLTLTDDDKRLSSDEHFKDFTEVIVTAKMDGENTTVYPDGTMHARSLDNEKQCSKAFIFSGCHKALLKRSK